MRIKDDYKEKREDVVQVKQGRPKNDKVDKRRKSICGSPSGT